MKPVGDCVLRRTAIPSVVTLGVCGLVIVTALVGAVHAEISVSGLAALYWTDDIGIFSATRRLSRDGDPTQPALDTHLTDKGSSMVFEPQLTLSDSFKNGLGILHVDLLGQGFIFSDDARFNQGMFRLQAVQSFSPQTRLRLRYSFTPDQFLGENEDRRPGRVGLIEERVASHIWSMRMEHAITEELELKLLGRYGLRRYNEAFAQRDTNFFTIGPHVDWRLSPRVTLGLGYHYERGLADGRNEPEFEDDVSYVNHYVTAELDIELKDRLSLLMAAHYERNNWTSGIPGDERNGGHEDIVQGEMILVRQISDRVRIFGGFQRSTRKESFDTSSVKNTNVGFGVSGSF